MTSIQQDTLQKFGQAFQTKCIVALLTDKEFIEQVYDILNPNYFESESNRWTIEKILWYFHEYKSLPTMEVFKKELDKYNVDESQKTAIKESLRNVYKALSATDLDYIKDEFLQFCKNQEWKNAITKSADLLSYGRYDEIRQIIEKARVAGMERNDGLDWIEDFEEIITKENRNAIKTPWPVINQMMDGGLGPGELGCIVAPSGAGKSWALQCLGYGGVQEKKNIVHYTLELREDYTTLRYYSIMAGLEPNKIRNHVPDIKEKLSQQGGSLKVKYFPTKTISYHAIKAHIQRRIILGMKPDMIIVDYADLLSASAKTDARYQELGAIYEELRGMGGELGIPIWTASQSQRSSIQDDIIEADKIAESYSKIMTADFVMSISRKQSDKIHNTARVHIIKNRFGPDGLTFPAEMNLSIGKIEIHEEDSIAGSTLKSGMNGSRILSNLIATKKVVDKSQENEKNDLG